MPGLLVVWQLGLQTHNASGKRARRPDRLAPTCQDVHGYGLMATGTQTDVQHQHVSRARVILCHVQRNTT